MILLLVRCKYCVLCQDCHLARTSSFAPLSFVVRRAVGGKTLVLSQMLLLLGR